MDEKSKYLLIAMGLLIVGTVVITYNRMVVLKDYQIIVEVPCDTYIDNCFVRTGEDGTVTNYKILSRNASHMPLCDPNQDKNCRAFICEPGEQKCKITVCSSDAVPEEEECSQS